jgi:hypothetical protein
METKRETLTDITGDIVSTIRSTVGRHVRDGRGRRETGVGDEMRCDGMRCGMLSLLRLQVLGWVLGMGGRVPASAPNHPSLSSVLLTSTRATTHSILDDPLLDERSC